MEEYPSLMIFRSLRFSRFTWKLPFLSHSIVFFLDIPKSLDHFQHFHLLRYNYLFQVTSTVPAALRSLSKSWTRSPPRWNGFCPGFRTKSQIERLSWKPLSKYKRYTNAALVRPHIPAVMKFVRSLNKCIVINLIIGKGLKYDLRS